jgi:hypothetical protein
MRKAIVVFALAAATTAASSARAFDDSTRRPFYVQSNVASFSYWPVLFQNQGYWHPDVEFGFHFSGRHDGFVLGVRQAFDVGRDIYSMGETLLRVGWDFALPFRNGRFELTLAPFATLGVNYVFQNLHAGFHTSLGFDAKLFFFQGLYVLVRPVELGLGEFVDLGPFAQNVYFNYSAGIGLGFAF